MKRRCTENGIDLDNTESVKEIGELKSEIYVNDKRPFLLFTCSRQLFLFFFLNSFDSNKNDNY